MNKVCARLLFVTSLAVGAVGPVSLGVLVACGTTAATTGVTPITGIVIRSDSLVSGLGCGPGAGQVFKYVAAVASADNPLDYLYANAFNCYADGDFSTIPIPDSGNSSFTVLILALNKDAYAAQSGSVDALFGLEQGNPDHPIDVSGITPTWTTTCQANQQQSIAVLAVCDALKARPTVNDAGSTRIQLATSSFPRADGGTFVCGTDFTSARALFVVDNVTMGQTGLIACPAPLVIDPVKPGASYALDVFLTKGPTSMDVANAMGCTATAVLGQTTTPNCPPFQ